MNLRVFVLIFLMNNASQHEVITPTVPIKDRIRYLKHKIREDLRFGSKPSKSRVVYDNYDYVDVNLPITPIMENDERKKDNKFMLRQLKTTTTTLPPEPLMPKIKKELVKQSPLPKKPVRSKSKNVSRHAAKTKDVFYRRDNYECCNLPIEWTHCSDMVTPLLTGERNEFVRPKVLHKDHRVVTRFLQLLRVDISKYAKEDVVALLYQISNIKLRLFQWHVSAMKALLNVICKGKKHTFLHLKRGIRALIKSWNMDLRNTSNLVHQTRIIRPPCIRFGELEGSTKTSMAMRYTMTPTTNSDEDK